MPIPRPAVEHVVFHAVSEHDAVSEEAHRPVRRRRHGHDAAAEQTPALQMVETQVDTSAIAASMPDDFPRRTKPRRRRGGPAADEPLQLVETQPGAGIRPEGQP